MEGKKPIVFDGKIPTSAPTADRSRSFWKSSAWHMVVP